MTQQAALAVMIGAALVVLGLVAWGWWRRSRRDAAPLTQEIGLPADANVRATIDGLYVATTVHDEPLERIAAPGLAFRDRARLTIADEGIQLTLSGRTLTIPADRLIAVDQSTVAIDRVVEKDGLVRITWLALTGAPVDSYVRAQDSSAKALADAIRPIVPSSATPTPTGADA